MTPEERIIDSKKKTIKKIQRFFEIKINKTNYAYFFESPVFVDNR